MDPETRKVRAFYEKFSFPGYEKYDSFATLIDRAEKGIYANLLNAQIRFRARVLDVGCGTGQLVNVLSTAGRYVIGCDLSLNSLSKGVGFRNRFSLENASFVQADIFNLPFREQSFDYVLCNGVLHHTRDPYEAFGKICTMIKPEGYVVVGLYNTFARTSHTLRKTFVHTLRMSFVQIRKLLSRRREYREKEMIWYMDQYEHPLESTHTIDEVLGWFRRNHIDYVNSIPKISFFDELGSRENLFAHHPQGGSLQHMVKQLGWVFTQAREGGYFVLIGKKIG